MPASPPDDVLAVRRMLVGYARPVTFAVDWPEFLGGQWLIPIRPRGGHVARLTKRDAELWLARMMADASPSGVLSYQQDSERPLAEQEARCPPTVNASA